MNDVLGEAPHQKLIVRDANGNIVERKSVRWWVHIGVGCTKTRGLHIGDRIEDAVTGRVLIEATAETVGAR